MNKEDLERAVHHGVKLLSGAVHGAVIPYDDNIYVLKQLLVSLSEGRVGLSPVKSPVKNEPSD